MTYDDWCTYGVWFIGVCGMVYSILWFKVYGTCCMVYVIRWCIVYDV